MNCLLKLNCLIRWHYAMQYLKYSEYYSNVTTIITRRIFNNLLKKYFRSHISWQNLRCIYVISVSFFEGGGGKGSMSWALANKLWSTRCHVLLFLKVFKLSQSSAMAFLYPYLKEWFQQKQLHICKGVDSILNLRYSQRFFHKLLLFHDFGRQI